VQRVLVALVLLAIAAGIVLVVVNAFEGEPPPPAVGPVTGPTIGPSEPPGPPPALEPTDRPPTTEPPVQLIPLVKEARALLLMDRSRPFTAFLTQHWRRHEMLRLRTFAFDGPTPPAGNDPPLDAPPSATFLDDEDVSVLAIDGLDPGLLPDALWESVARRVKARTMGLLVLPGWLPTKGRDGGGPPTVHPMLRHRILKTLLPVSEAEPIEGPALPGVFSVNAPFEVTEAGKAHPATRIVAWPEWSGRVWESGAAGKRAWGTKFCYPVTKTPDGAVVLLRVVPPRGGKLPAVIQGAPAGGRVLWVGLFDFGQESYKDPDAVEKWGALAGNWMAWLADQAK
jgi:hypothetical protein